MKHERDYQVDRATADTIMSLRRELKEAQDAYFAMRDEAARLKTRLAVTEQALWLTETELDDERKLRHQEKVEATAFAEGRKEDY